VTVQAEVDAAGLIATRARLADQGSGVPLEALVARCIVPALSEFPLLNATLDGNDIIIHRRHDLGFAVDTEDGLMVAVVRGAGDLSTAGLAARITDLTARARTRSITPDEVTGQTFTISNIGALGGGHGTPIIPIGTTAILSIGRVRAAAVVVAGVVDVAQMMPIDLSYDHRVVDGGLGQRFLDRLVANLESPGAHA
jgi:pyruvate/2-oxoglutarate dehydrogenase complex dihydrolipoamide acyltransferase (E2) component